MSLSRSQVVVHVTNNLVLEGLTIHWHGMHMRGNPWMDGVPYVTQCPIMPQQTFTYRFVAAPAGTHWYHSHFKNQRLDGLFGMLVIHKSTPSHPEFWATVGDWWAYDALDSNILHPLHKFHPGAGDIMTHPLQTAFSGDNNLMSLLKFHSILINGKGRYDTNSTIPLTQFALTPGERHRLRMVHSGSDNILEISLDNHNLAIISSDGYDVIPIQVDAFQLHPGETMDVEVVADQPSGKYWLRAQTLRHGVGLFPTPDNITEQGRAIVTYDPNLGPEDPTTSTRTCTEDDPCMIFNCIFQYPSRSNRECISIADARSTSPQSELDSQYGLQDEDVEEFFLNFGLPHGIPTINNRVDLDGRAPVYTENFDSYITPCEKEDCTSKVCRCTHIQTLPYNKTVQLVLYTYNPGELILPHHNAHLHGSGFAVLALGFPSVNDSTGFWSEYNPDIICDDENPYYCVKPRWNQLRQILNTDTPPIKDAVVIPSRGYVVIRFRTMNPGPWLFHCHHEFHALDGMVMTLNVAPDKQPPPPPGLPTCPDFTWTSQQFQDYLTEDREPEADGESSHSH